MIDINLLPDGKQPLGKFLTWVLSYGRYIIVGTEIIVLLAFLSRFKFDRELTDLHQAISQKQTVVLAAYDLENKVRALQNHLLIIKKLGNQRDFTPKLLSVLEQLTPDEVTLIKISADQSKFNVTANALTNEGFTTFINNLSGSHYFNDISLDNVGKAQNGGIEFKVTADLKDL